MCMIVRVRIYSKYVNNVNIKTYLNTRLYEETFCDNYMGRGLKVLELKIQKC